MEINHDANWSLKGQKGDAWDGGHHVPKIVSWPKHIKQAGDYEQTVGLIDIYATLAEITGQTLVQGQAEDSFSFKTVLDGDLKNSIRDQILYLSASGKLAIKKGDWKYIDCLGSGGVRHLLVLILLKMDQQLNYTICVLIRWNNIICL